MEAFWHLFGVLQFGRCLSKMAPVQEITELMNDIATHKQKVGPIKPAAHRAAAERGLASGEY